MDRSNNLLKILEKLEECSYESKTKYYLSQIIPTILKYPNKGNKSEYFVENLNGDNIIIIDYSMMIKLGNIKYNVPIKIVLTKNIPNEPPKFFIPMKEYIGINKSNKDIDQNTFRIMTKTLRSWNNDSNIENVLDEIYVSFSTHFPIFRKKSQNLNNSNNGDLSNSVNLGFENNDFQLSNNNYNNNINNKLTNSYNYNNTNNEIFDNNNQQSSIISNNFQNAINNNNLQMSNISNICGINNQQFNNCNNIGNNQQNNNSLIGINCINNQQFNNFPNLMNNNNLIQMNNYNNLANSNSSQNNFSNINNQSIINIQPSNNFFNVNNNNINNNQSFNNYPNDINNNTNFINNQSFNNCPNIINNTNINNQSFNNFSNGIVNNNNNP